METLIKVNRTKRAKVAILCLSTVFLCNHAVAQNTFTVTEKENIKGNECTKTFNCYYGDNDERIMHGLCKTVGKENKVEDKDHKYSFSHTENINYSHGKKEGAYSFQQKESTTTTAVYHNYQTDRDYVQRSSANENREITGSYKNDERDGVWKETFKERDTLWKPYGREIERTNVKDEKNTFVYSNGKLIELTTPDAHYTFKYTTRDKKDVTLLSGNYDKYTIKDGIIVSHIVRLNGDETPIENDLKQFIDSKDNLFEHQDELLEKGFVLKKAYIIKYKQRPSTNTNLDDFDYEECAIYKIWKEQIIYASQSEIIQYLSNFRDKDFDNEYNSLIEKKYFFQNGKKYVKEEDLTALQPSVNKYKELLSQIQNAREEANKLKDKIKAEDKHNKNAFHSIMKSQGDIPDNFPFTTDKSKCQNQLEKIQAYLKVEQDYYAYVVKGDKTNLINAKADSIKSIVGEDSRVWKTLSSMYSEHHKYSFFKYTSALFMQHVEMKKELFYEYVNDVDEGLTTTENCLDYIQMAIRLSNIANEVYKNPNYSFVKVKYGHVFESYNKEWNGKEDGNRIRPLIEKLELLKNHLESIAIIEKNNERIVQLTEKAKNIKKIYTNYYNNIQKEYSDNTPVDYLSIIIGNQNALIAALEANDVKELDKTVKKGKAETMEDIIQITKQH